MSKRKIYKESDGYKSEDFLQSAYHHFAAAQKLLEDTPELFDSGGYLLHLSVELLFKSWLLHVNQEFNGTHSLQHLRDKVCKLKPNLKFTKNQNKVVEHLDNLYELRYPSRQKPTEIGSEEIELVKEVLDRIVNLLPEDLYSRFESIPYGTKSGRVLMEKSKNIPLDFDLITGKNKI
jgi:HEPN domain-containing protein